MKKFLGGFKLQNGVRTDLATGEVVPAKSRIQDVLDYEEEVLDVPDFLKRWQSERNAARKGGSC